MKVLVTIFHLLGGFLVAAQSFDVDHITGAANVSIPVGSISSAELRHNITLNYRGGGVAVNAATSRVGLGWSIQAGGFISREVRGLPDEYLNLQDSLDLRKGWLHHTFHNDIQTLNLNWSPESEGEEPSNWSVISNLIDFTRDSLLTAIDMEPDVFHINAPGISCKFLIGPEGEVLTFPHMDLNISYEMDSVTHRIERFVITNNHGIVHEFDFPRLSGIRYNPKEGHTGHIYLPKVIHDYSQFILFNSVWHMTLLTSPNRDYLRFQYDSAIIDETQILRFDLPSFGWYSQEIAPSLAQIMPFRNNTDCYVFNWEDLSWVQSEQYEYIDIVPPGVPRPILSIYVRTSRGWLHKW